VLLEIVNCFSHRVRLGYDFFFYDLPIIIDKSIFMLIIIIAGNYFAYLRRIIIPAKIFNNKLKDKVKK